MNPPGIFLQGILGGRIAATLSSKLILNRVLHTLAVNQSMLAFSNPFLGRQGVRRPYGLVETESYLQIPIQAVIFY